MLRQVDKREIIAAFGAGGLAVAASLAIGAATGDISRVPECAQLARAVANREQSLPDTVRFRRTEQSAYRVCAGNPAAFRKLIGIS